MDDENTTTKQLRDRVALLPPEQRRDYLLGLAHQSDHDGRPEAAAAARTERERLCPPAPAPAPRRTGNRSRRKRTARTSSRSRSPAPADEPPSVDLREMLLEGIRALDDETILGAASDDVALVTLAGELLVVDVLRLHALPSNVRRALRPQLRQLERVTAGRRIYRGGLRVLALADDGACLGAVVAHPALDPARRICAPGGVA